MSRAIRHDLEGYMSIPHLLHIFLQFLPLVGVQINTIQVNCIQTALGVFLEELTQHAYTLAVNLRVAQVQSAERCQHVGFAVRIQKSLHERVVNLPIPV